MAPCGGTLSGALNRIGVIWSLLSKTSVVRPLALGGCGGSDEPRTEPEPSAGTVVAALGDSDHGGGAALGPEPRHPGGDRPAARPPQPVRALGRAGAAEDDFRNCGVPGELSDEIARRLDECADGADVLIVQGGVNDISIGREPAEIAPHLREMVRAGERLGLRVAIAELLPWNGGYPAAADPLIRDLNRRIARNRAPGEREAAAPGTAC